MGTVVKPTYIFLTAKPWNDATFTELEKDQNVNWVRIKSKEEFQYSKIAELQPAKIFIPHWSYMIPAEIFNSFECIVFHMTDLPYGRGGSPLQNLIQRGHSKTKLTTLRCMAELDAGPIYDQEEISLEGSAEEIFLRADHVIEAMIKRHVQNKLDPQPQKGKPVYFKRRSPDQSNLATCSAGDLLTWYDHIRMLDADGYPHAYLQVGDLRLEFRRSSLRSDGIHCDVRISSNPKTAFDQA